MINITCSRFGGIVSYKMGEFDFTNNCGLTTVTGHNRDSRISKEQNNGAGKSLMFSMLPNVAFEQTPMADTKKKNRIHSKGSFIEIDVENLGHKWTIRQQAGGYKVLRDGEDMKFGRQGDARIQIEKILPLTQDEWYSYVHLQSQKKLEFLYGTPRARMSYISQVWRLDQFDVLRRYFDKRIEEVKVAQNKSDAFTHQLMNINDQLNKNGWNKKLDKELAEAKEVVKTQSKKVTKLQSQRQELKSLAKQVEFYSTTKQKLKKLQKKLKYDKAELRDQYKLHQEQEKYDDDLEEYQRKVKKWEAKLAELGGVEGGGKKAEFQLKKLRTELKHLEEQDRKLEKVRDKHDAAVRELENLDDHVDPDLRKFLSKCNKQGVDPMEALKEEYTTAKTTMKLADLLHDHDGGNCPTCMQAINVKDLEKTIAQAKKRKGKAHSMIHALEIRITKQENTETIKALKFDERAFYAARKRIKVINGEIDKLEENIKNAGRWEEIMAQLNDLKKPKPPARRCTISMEKIEEQKEILDEVARLKGRLEEYDEVPEDDNILKRLAEVEAKLEKVEKKYTKAQKITVRYSSLKAEFKLLSKQREEASQKVEEFAPLIKKMKRFKILSKAYSNKGLKLNAMHEIVYGLQQNYNKYAQLIFAEPFKFTVNAKDDGVHIMVDRGQGNVSDVRELSGAESDSFRLLHFLACVIMAKDDRRVNLAILDEPDAHMDQATTNLFVERYVPFLRKLVPHVFIITQKGKHLHPECSYVTVEKFKGVSNVRYDAV